MRFGYDVLNLLVLIGLRRSFVMRFDVVVVVVLPVAGWYDMVWSEVYSMLYDNVLTVMIWYRLKCMVSCGNGMV